ncbi:hypothetical protein [Mycoplasma hafezii]|uniref:hypothetical protein n=1 Tax=Mycoplasma hafezii TaxID=525886 RepID=UPI003CEFF7DD
MQTEIQDIVSKLGLSDKEINKILKELKKEDASLRDDVLGHSVIASFMSILAQVPVVKWISYV